MAFQAFKPGLQGGYLGAEGFYLGGLLRGLSGHLFRQNSKKGSDRLGHLPADPFVRRFQCISHRASPLRDRARMTFGSWTAFPSGLATKHTPGTSQYLFKLTMKPPA